MLGEEPRGPGGPLQASPSSSTLDINLNTPRANEYSQSRSVLPPSDSAGMLDHLAAPSTSSPQLHPVVVPRYHPCASSLLNGTNTSSPRAGRTARFADDDADSLSTFYSASASVSTRFARDGLAEMPRDYVHGHGYGYGDSSSFTTPIFLPLPQPSHPGESPALMSPPTYVERSSSPSAVAQARSASAAASAAGPTGTAVSIATVRSSSTPSFAALHLARAMNPFGPGAGVGGRGDGDDDEGVRDPEAGLELQSLPPATVPLQRTDSGARAGAGGGGGGDSGADDDASTAARVPSFSFTGVALGLAPQSQQQVSRAGVGADDGSVKAAAAASAADAGAPADSPAAPESAPGIAPLQELGTLGLRPSLPPSTTPVSARGKLTKGLSLLADADTGALWVDASPNVKLSFVSIFAISLTTIVMVLSLLTGYPLPTLGALVLVLCPCCVMSYAWYRCRARVRLDMLIRSWSGGAVLTVLVTLLACFVALAILISVQVFATQTDLASDMTTLIFVCAIVAMFFLCPLEEGLKYLLLTHPRSAPLVQKNAPEALLYHVSFLVGMSVAQSTAIVWLASLFIISYVDAPGDILISIGAYFAVFSTFIHVSSGYAMLVSMILRRNFPGRLPRYSRRARAAYAPRPPFIADRWYGVLLIPTALRSIFYALVLLIALWPEFFGFLVASILSMLICVALAFHIRANLRLVPRKYRAGLNILRTVAW